MALRPYLSFSSEMIAGLDTTVDFEVKYYGDELAMDVESCQLDLVDITRERFNELEIVLPERASGISIVKFKGSALKQGKDFLFHFVGEIGTVPIPLPIVPDIEIKQGRFYYHYESIAPLPGQSADLSGQVVFIGCEIGLQEGLLKRGLGNSSLKGAYFLSNKVSLVYFDFSGTISTGQTLQALLGGDVPLFDLDIEHAGIFQLNKKKSQKRTKEKGITYPEALAQLIGLSENVKPDDETTALIPQKFPLTSLGSDFKLQFEKTFYQDDITGIGIWLAISRNKVEAFDSLLSIGYEETQVNKLIMYGFKTKKIGGTSSTNTYTLYAQLPTTRLFDNTLTLGGTGGRDGVLLSYQSDKKEYTLSGSIGIDFFNSGDQPPPLLFEGDLNLNKERLKAKLTLTLSSPSQTIESPFDMAGVKFAGLSLILRKKFKTASSPTKPKLCAIISGVVNYTFENGSNVCLSGAIAIEDKTRLVVVSLNTNPNITLSDFITEIAKKSWEWVDTISENFALCSGNMYFLKCVNASFSYPDPIDTLNAWESDDIIVQPTVYQRGYHAEIILKIFKEYEFAANIDIQNEGFALRASYQGAIDAYFISLQSPSVAIKTIGVKTFELGVEKVTLFGTDIGGITAGYKSLGDGKGYGFAGDYTYDKSGTKFTIGWQWAKTTIAGKQKFKITKLEGLELEGLDIAEKFIDFVGALSTNACTAAINEILSEFVFTSSFSLKSNGAIIYNQPTFDQPTVNIPFKIGYTFNLFNSPIYSSDIEFEKAEITIPSSLENLSSAIFDTINDNLDEIIDTIMSDPDTYNIIALEIAKIGLTKLAAYMLCKLVEKLAEKLAEMLAEAIISGAIGEGAADGLAALAGAIVGVIGGAAAGSIIVHLANSGDDDIKEQFDEIKEAANKSIAIINSQIHHLKENIQLENLLVGVDEDGDEQFKAAWRFKKGHDAGGSEHIEYQLVFLEGEIGTQNAPPLADLVAIGFEPMTQMTYTKDWSSLIGQAPSFEKNVSVQTRVKNISFVTQQVLDDFEEAKKKLKELEDDIPAAAAFITKLENFLTQIQTYQNKGVLSEKVYATEVSGSSFIIGLSNIGQDTFIYKH